MSKLMDQFSDDAFANGFNNGQGWDALKIDPNSVKKQLEEMAREQREEALRIAAWFDKTPEGRAAMAWIMRQTVLRSPNDFELMPASMELYAIHKAKREGQNSVAMMIIAAVQLARQEEETK